MPNRPLFVHARSASLAVLLCAASACTSPSNRTVLGYAPVYGNPDSLKQITASSPRPTEKAGKIYAYDQLTFQIEQGEGIHVIDRSDPAQPKKIAFIGVKGCSEVAIKNQTLYTDNFRDLVGIDISNLSLAHEIARLPLVFPAVDQEYPPAEGTFFECPDPSKGTVVGWTRKMLTNPKCKR